MDNNKSVSTAGDEPASAEQGSKGVLKLGLDMHYRQVTVAMQQEHGPIKAVGKLSHEGFWAWVESIRLTNYTADHGAGLLGLLSVRPCGGREFSDLVNWKVAQSWQD